MSTLLDTNVLSELLRPRPAEAVIAWFASQSEGSLCVSAVTQAEMLLGARLLPEGSRRRKLQTRIDALFREEFTGRLLPFDARAAEAYAGIVADRRAAGRPISVFDAQIAAIALANRLKVATRNAGDFEGCNVMLVDPWR